MRALAIDAAIAAGSSAGDVDSLAALALAESRGVAIITKNRDLVSGKVAVLYC